MKPLLSIQFLSIAGRELRVASRKRGTFRVRVFTSFLAVCITGFSLWFVTLLGSSPVRGETLFFALSWLSFICACLAGPALTADSVNEERNNGTLGLLFLTNLRALSIALGKLAGHGLLALYSIVAIIPVMALPALLGGTDAASLAKTALVLFVTLILSLVIGMLASTLCRKPWIATAVALLVLAVIIVAIPLAAFVLRLNQHSGWSAWLDLLSPTYSLSMASPYAAGLPRNGLWPALGIQTLIALLFFGLVTFLLPRVWQEGRSGRKANRLQSLWRAFKYGSAEPRRRLRIRLLRINPVLWLAARERFGPMGFAVVLLGLALAIFWTGQRVNPGFAPNDEFFVPMITWIFATPLLYMAFCFRLAAAASERFAVDRKVGALELIICTPIQTREIIRGHWLALVRRFWGSALLLFALHGFVLNYIMEAIRLEPGLSRFGLREVIVRPVRHLFGADFIPNEVAPFYIACLAFLTAMILIVVLWIALGWIGMALSLKLRREVFAPWLSVFLLALPPIPLFFCAVALLDDKELFASNLFIGMLRVGASGFFLVLTNALLWLFLARRFTWRKLRATDIARPRVRQ